jgi:hypothetical protein
VKSKVIALETTNATKATAAAIARATEDIKGAKAQNVYVDLRITNMEKCFKDRSKNESRKQTKLSPH